MARRKREQGDEPAQKKRLNEQQIVTFGDIFPGFDSWYRANHDEDGRYIGQMLPGLRAPVQTEDDEEQRA